MPQSILGTTLIATKLSSSGNFLLQFQNVVGGIQFIVSIPSADMATIAALASGSSVTKQYVQDMNKNDYPQHFQHSEGN